MTKGGRLPTHKTIRAHIIKKGNQSTSNHRDGSRYCFYKHYFKVSCALNTHFEHINWSRNFEPSYHHYSTWPNNWFNAYLHIIKWRYFEGLSINHPLHVKSFSNACRLVLRPQISTRMRTGCCNASLIGLFSHKLESRQLKLPVNHACIECGLMHALCWTEMP